MWHSWSLGRGNHSPDQLDAYLLAIVDRVTRRMRAADRIGTTLVMRLRYDDFTQATRSRTLNHPTSSTEPIAQLALAMLHREAESITERGLTLIGLSVSNLADTSSVPEQLILPFGRKPTDGLDDAVDQLRHRFGNTAITRGSLAGKSTGWETPKLPD